MHLLRGRKRTIAADREVTARLLDLAADGEPAVRVWIPHRQVAFGRRDARRQGYDRARRRADEAGFSPIERSVGGRAVAFDGETTLAVARAEPIADFRAGISDRYDQLLTALERGLSLCGVSVARGEPPNAFCPGSHSLQATDSGKIAGVAQRVRHHSVLVSGILLVDNADTLASVLGDIYDALAVPFEPSTVGSVAAAGGSTAVESVRQSLEDVLVGEAEPTVEQVD